MTWLKKYRWVSISLLASIVTVIMVVIFSTSGGKTVHTVDENVVLPLSYSPTSYQTYLGRFPDQFPSLNVASFLPNDGPLVPLNSESQATYTVIVSMRGFYQLSVDVQDLSPNLLSNRFDLKINGDYPFDEARALELPVHWLMPSPPFPLDRYGNEIMPIAFKNPDLQTIQITDPTGLHATPFRFHLEAGENTLTLSHIQGDFSVGLLRLHPVLNLDDYETYIARHASVQKAPHAITVAAEDFVAKTNPSSRLMSLRDPSATRYDTQDLFLNTLDGWSFRQGNDAVLYQIDVPETGLYELSFKYRQNYLMQMPVFREIRINGNVPFEEMRWVPFHYSNNFTTVTLGEEDPYLYYLEAGVQTIEIRVVLEPYRNSYVQIVSVMEEMTDLSLQIKRLTGNTQDRYRNWKLADFIPDVEARLQSWIDTLALMEEGLKTYSEHANPGELTHLNIARQHLNRLINDIDDVPNQMTLLADGDSSAAQLLGTMAQILLENGLDIESMYLVGEAPMPRTRPNPIIQAWESTKRFFLSFSNQNYAVIEADDDTLEIWVNYPRQYVEVMQQIIDQTFTPETGIKVLLSIMPDENKLILANAANRGPDIALGVNHWVPYEFAIRDAALDLRDFEGYEEMVSRFAPGVMIPYAFEDGLYGLPLTQNFWVTFYRTDIMNSLDLPVPETWNEVIEILPELQRFGMNYFQPIALFGGFKPFVATIPFIHQFGGELYSPNGMETMINSDANIEGIQLMTELFTIYDMPKQVPNFYNHFRTGLLPIGISDLATYLQLTIAAPEIAGKWNIAPHPGVMNENGEIVRYAAAGAQSVIILRSTDKPDESWLFLDWFLSTETQVDFAYRLQTANGTEFLWNTANLEAFRQIPLPAEHIDVILAQWEFAIEASRIPGAYMVERELSNAWNKIVFDDANPRITLDNAVRIANREIVYRMEEFGYVENSQIIKPYPVPTIETIDYWLRGRNHD